MKGIVVRNPLSLVGASKSVLVYTLLEKEALRVSRQKLYCIFKLQLISYWHDKRSYFTKISWMNQKSTLLLVILQY